MADDDTPRRSGFAMVTPVTGPAGSTAGEPGPRAGSPGSTAEPAGSSTNAAPGATNGSAGAKGSGASDPVEVDPTGAEAELRPGDLVDLDAERATTDVDEVLERLDRELVGLAPVKTRVREIASLLLVDRARRRFGLGSDRPSLHMCFTGSPGTGKTTVALRMAELLHRMGYLRRNQLVSVTRDDLVGQYIGHTAPKTREVLKRAMGGVLFIDEAYYLYRAENERDYGQETIEILLQAMENDRDDLVVILAGYKDRMDSFFGSNPGMGSRVAHHIDFPDYSADELLAIARLMLDEQGYVLSPEGERTLAQYLRLRMAQPRFANARSVRNALERARLRHADRLVRAGGSVGREDLMRIDAVDFARSRVFSQGTEDIDPDPMPSA